MRSAISKIDMYVLSVTPVLFGYSLSIVIAKLRTWTGSYRDHCRDRGLCRVCFCVSTCTGAPLPALTLNQRQCTQDPCLSFLCVVTWYSHLKYSTTAAYGSDFPVHIVNCRRSSAMLYQLQTDHVHAQSIEMFTRTLGSQTLKVFMLIA